MDAQFWRGLSDWFESISLVVVGASLTWLGTWFTDQRTRAQSRDSEASAAEARRYELGRTATKDLLATANAMWEELVSNGAGSPVTLRTSTGPRTIARLGEQIPNRDIREAANAVGQFLDNPELFETSTEFSTLTFPKGPAGSVPTGLKALISVESLINMLNAFLREENPAAFRNPLLDTLISVSRGRRLTAADIYDQH